MPFSSITTPDTNTSETLSAITEEAKRSAEALGQTFAVVREFELIHYFTLAAIIIVTIVLHRVVKYFLTGPLARIVRSTKTPYDDEILKAITEPMGMLIILLGFYMATKLLPFPQNAENLLLGIAKVCWHINIAYFLYRFVSILALFLKNLAHRADNNLDEGVAVMIGRALKISVITISFIFIAQNLGFNMSGLLAGLGIGGLAVALAAQDTFANFFGSFVILLTKPFLVGERILVMGFDGVVEHIGLRSTRIRTLSGTVVTLPNKEVVAVGIENINERPSIKFLEEIGIEYSTSTEKIRKAVSIIKEILDNTENLTEEKFVHFNKFGDFSLTIRYFFWVTPADYWMAQDIQQEIKLKIKERFDEEGIAFAFPTQTLHAFIKNDNHISGN